MKQALDVLTAELPGLDVPFIRSPYNYDRAAASRDSCLLCPEATRTKQEFAHEADINTIVDRFGVTGELPHGVRMPQYGDFTAVGTYQEALNAVIAAQESFMAMPAAVRSRFHNDPEAFLAFCGNPENREEAIKLGLVVEPQPVVAEAAKAVSEPSAGGS